MSDEIGTTDGWIVRLSSADPAWRNEAALVLGDWLYPRGGMSDAEGLRIHQALLEAALVEDDAEARRNQLNALVRSNRSLAGIVGWGRLVERAPAMDRESQELAFALLSVAGEPSFADRLEALMKDHPHLDHALTRKTIGYIRQPIRPA